MTGRQRYAEGTTVRPEKTRAEIEVLLTRVGADAFRSGWDAHQSNVEFHLRSRVYRLGFAFPDAGAPQFRQTPTGKPRGDGQAQAAHQAEIRRLWRCLKLLILSKIEVVESGISDYETELLPYVVMPTGDTLAAWVLPRLATALAGQDALLLLPAGR